jgi:hypothetical protein
MQGRNFTTKAYRLLFQDSARKFNMTVILQRNRVTLKVAVFWVVVP